jgi:kynurenine formamidase
MSNISFDKVIDLSHSIYTECPSWATLPTMHTEILKYTSRDGDTVSMISKMHMHTGTHVDSPKHFIENGAPIGAIDLRRFMGDGIVINFSYKKNSEEITDLDLKKYDDQIKENDVIMLYTGWSKKRGYNSEYMFEWPYLGKKGAQYLVDKKIKAVGIDSMSIGGWSDYVPGRKVVVTTDSSVTHKTLLKAGITIIEELNNLDEVLAINNVRRAYFMYMPIKIRDAEAAPVRAVAFV